MIATTFIFFTLTENIGKIQEKIGTGLETSVT